MLDSGAVGLIWQVPPDDMLSPRVAWVEQGRAPGAIVATARGPGNAAAVDASVPASCVHDRSRPRCAYPQVARYNGSGSLEVAASFTCQ